MKGIPRCCESCGELCPPCPQPPARPPKPRRRRRSSRAVLGLAAILPARAGPGETRAAPEGRACRGCPEPTREFERARDDRRASGKRGAACRGRSRHESRESGCRSVPVRVVFNCSAAKLNVGGLRVASSGCWSSPSLRRLRVLLSSKSVLKLVSRKDTGLLPCGAGAKRKPAS